MKHISLGRVLATTAFVSLSLLGVSTAASAAPLSDATATSSAEIGITGTNATAITISATAVTGAPADMFNVSLPSGWTFVTPAASCTDVTLTGFPGSTSCQLINIGTSGGFATIQPGVNLIATTAYSVTFAPNTLNVAGTRDFSISLDSASASGASVDSGTAILAGGTPPAPAPAPAEPTLALTGANGLPLVAGAAGLAIVGGALLFARRRCATA